MLKLSNDINKTFSNFIKEQGVQPGKLQHYLKWLRFYLDFCNKYQIKTCNKKSIILFDKKLQDKHQPEGLRNQAKHAIGLFWKMQARPKEKAGDKNQQDNKSISKYSSLRHNKENKYDQVGISQEGVKKSDREYHKSTDWTDVYEQLTNAIKLRHYSPKTLKTYTSCVRNFQTYLKSKEPGLVNIDDVKAFLTSLAVERGVSASSQNISFNALLFLFRNVFSKEFGKVDGIVRAKKKPYIPVVLSRNEIDIILELLSYPFDIIIKLMYGCGLRISECLSLRVQNFNFDMKILTIHDGKGKKDRTVPIPETLTKELMAQLKFVIELHEEDCQSEYDGVFLFNQLEKKYVNASKELIWQWFFPAKDLTYVSKKNQYRRYHVHDTVLQKALRRAVRKSKIPKRVTSHTFRHSFASHLLQANYDIRTIQELMGHSDVRTTMIYTHTVKSVTKKEAMSPLDF